MQHFKGQISAKYNKTTGTVHLIGSTKIVQEVEPEIIQFLTSWNSEGDTLSIKLSSVGRKYLLHLGRLGMKELVKKFPNSSFVIKKDVLYVTEGKECWQQIEQFLREVNENNTEGNIIAQQNECLVCFDTITDENKFVLTSCGHTNCCRTCLIEHINVSITDATFPINCLSCSVPILLCDLKEIIPQSLKGLFKSSYRKYIMDNRSKFNLCLTPDCSGIARKEKSPKYDCKECLRSYCILCQLTYHDGLTCEQYKSVAVFDRQFEEWKKTSDSRPCPNCLTPILKNSGCNHMTCALCRAHFCWLCTPGGPNQKTSGPVYEHLNRAHNGYFT